MTLKRAAQILTLLAAHLSMRSHESHAASAAAVKARAITARTPVYASPGGQRLGYLKVGTEVPVLFRTADGQYLVLDLKKKDGSRVQAYGRADQFRTNDSTVDPNEDEEAVDSTAETSPSEDSDVDDHEARNNDRRARRRDHDHGSDEGGDEEKPFNRWSLGFGFSGSSSESGTRIVISGDLRYLWTKWLETLLGLDLALGDESAVGLRVGQRVYAPISDSFRPFAHVGYRMGDLRTIESAALEFGGGFQVAYRRGSYFELGIFYLFPKPFNQDAESAILFGGSSGIRF